MKLGMQLDFLLSLQLAKVVKLSSKKSLKIREYFKNNKSLKGGEKEDDKKDFSFSGDD
jgi:hypothetical protein